MAIKESSDELNPSVEASAEQVAPPRRRSAGDFFALAIATCGVGYLPTAPGTWGSLVGVGLYLALRSLALDIVHHFGPVNILIFLNPQVGFVAIQLVVGTFVTLIGIWAASRAERIFQEKDPGKVVIDEVAGQLIALLPVPLLAAGPWRLWILISFLLFRAFDIVKPYPVRQLETLESGLGIVVDDLAAGAYAAVVLSVTIAIWFIVS